MNENYIRRWRSSTSLVFWGVIIQYVFVFIGIALTMYVSYNLIDILVGGIVPSMASMNFDYYESRFAGFLGTATLCVLISFLGYILYLIGICLFKSPQRSINSELRVRNIMLVELIMPALLILFCFVWYNYPDVIMKTGQTLIFYMLLPVIVSLVAIIFLVIQYKSLAGEETWSELARLGARNLKVSYQCILWLAVVTIVGAICMFSSAYWGFASLSSMKHDTYEMSGMFEQANTLVNTATDTIATLKREVIFFELVTLILLTLCIVYRIMGWRRIRLGGNEEVWVFETPVTGVKAYSVKGQFCHKCGTELAVDSSFCSKCGAPVVEIAALERENPVSTQPGDSMEDSVTEIASIPQQEEQPIDYGEEENPRRRQWILWGSIAAGAVVLILGLWAIFGRQDKFEPDAKIFVETAAVYEAVKDRVPDTPLCELTYGTPVRILPDGETGNWKKILFENNGKVVEGVVDKNNIVYSDEFETLEFAGLSNREIREEMKYGMQRLAVLQAAKSLDGKWKLEEMEDYDGDNIANLKSVLVRKVSPSEQCFAFVLENSEDDEKRVAFVFSTPDVFDADKAALPVFLAHEEVPLEKGRLVDVTYNKSQDSYNFAYLIKMGYCGDDEYDGGEEYYEETYNAPSNGPSPTQYLGAINLRGQIAAKYDISMTLFERDNGSLSGSYRYLKNDSPINLSGTYSNIGEGVQVFSIEEYVNGNNTGTFSGRFDGYTFRGTWVSADGERELPFNVTRY